MYRTDFWTLWEKARVGWSERIALKHIYYQVWNRSPAPVGCMRQVLRAGALGRPRGMGWGGRWEGDSGWGTHVNPWLIHVNGWQKPLQFCKVISPQLIQINEKKKKEREKCVSVPKFKAECKVTEVELNSYPLSRCWFNDLLLINQMWKEKIVTLQRRKLTETTLWSGWTAPVLSHVDIICPLIWCIYLSDNPSPKSITPV